MRLVIDLQMCQEGGHGSAGSDGVLKEALALVGLVANEGGGRHQLWIALRHRKGSGDSQSIESLRCAFDGLIARSRIVIFDLPASSADLWQQRASEQIREAFLAALKPDLVYVPHFSGAETEVVYSIGSLSAGFVTAVSLSDNVALSINQTQMPQYRLRASLKNSALAFAYSANASAAIHSAMALESAQVIDLSDSKNDECEAAQRGSSAQRMLKAFEAAVAENQKRAERSIAPSLQRPRLAYISPLPPEKSGIADYSVELLHELARYYDIDVILNQSELAAPWVIAHLSVHPVAWFEKNAGEYDRVLYHFGNSPMHQHMFELFERHPGIVVLHDFYLGHALQYLAHYGDGPGAFLRALYMSHGWPAVLDRKQIGATKTTWKYPCNKVLLDQAEGVIVHSRFSVQLARRWYGEQAAADWAVLPLLRGKPPLASEDASLVRLPARHELTLSESDFVVCSFGMLGPAKLNERLLDAWLASPLAQDPHCHLIFVGENYADEYGKNLSRKIAASPCRKRISITGFLSHKQYVDYLHVADCAVQLRTNSRGETSAAILDCLLYGLPTIVNAHGASAELPDDVVLMLAEDSPQDALVDAMLQLHVDVARRKTMGQMAVWHIKEKHAPELVGQQFNFAIEKFAANGVHRQYRKLLQAISRIPALQPPDERVLTHTAIAIAGNRPATAPRQFFVDISAMVLADLKTGIQRVVRSVLMALLQNTPAGFRVEPVYCKPDGSAYRYAREYMSRKFELDTLNMDDAPLEIRSGDLFLGIDLFTSGVVAARGQLQNFRTCGVQIFFVVHDILPLSHPEYFPTGSDRHFRAWLQTIACVSDGLVCISRAVADEVAHWLDASPVLRQAPLPLGYFHLGADIEASVPSMGMQTDSQQILDVLRAQPSILMVGTVEPRKGYTQSLSAFEELWSKGGKAGQVNLVIVGKQGWMVDTLASRLRAHPEIGKRLFWLEGISDQMLDAVYQSCAGLLAASEGEGFGLPLVEAARHQLPIIARALPVFREVAGSHAFYFDGWEATSLARALHEWLRLHAAGLAPTSQGMQWLTWEQSAQQLLQTILKQQWYRTIPAGVAPKEVREPRE